MSVFHKVLECNICCALDGLQGSEASHPHCREPAWGIPPVTRSCGRGLMGKANQASGFPPGISWACTPKIRTCPPYCIVLFHSSDTLWTKLTHGFSLLHLKGMFQFKPPLITSLPNKFPWTFYSLWIVYSLPTMRGTGSLKHPRNAGASEVSRSLE